jgi:hypothetical protein
MISVRVYVHWLNRQAFTCVVSAHHARVTKLAHRHIAVRVWQTVYLYERGGFVLSNTRFITLDRGPVDVARQVAWTPIKFTHSSRADNTDT